jgi:DNA-binding PadR family transcriptional regulator
MENLTAFQRDILCVVAGMDEPHGLAIKAELEDYYEGEVNHGRLYPNLDDLVEQNLLDKGAHDQRTNCYTVTEEGRRSLGRRRRWELQYLSDIDQVNTPTP